MVIYYAVSKPPLGDATSGVFFIYDESYVLATKKGVPVPVVQESLRIC